MLQSNAAVLLLFGGPHCGVCQTIKPQLEKLAADEFPGLVTAYIDCQDTAGAMCAARGIFRCRWCSSGSKDSALRSLSGCFRWARSGMR